MRGLIVVVFVALLGFAKGDECDLEGWEEKMDAKQCCKIPDAFVSDTMDASYQKCEMMHDKDDFDCIGECTFLQEGLLTPEKTIDSEAITKYITSPDAEFKPVVAASVQKCLSTYLTELKTGGKSSCKSGADIYMRCVDREIFVNCPESKWTSTTPKCEELKTKATKCKISIEL